VPGATPGWSAVHRTYHLLLETVSAASIMLTIFYWVSDAKELYAAEHIAQLLWLYHRQASTPLQQH
jgi:hypothetical protein